MEARKKLIGIYVTDKAFVEEKVVEFARKQAVSNAIVNSVPDLEAGITPRLKRVSRKLLRSD